MVISGVIATIDTIPKASVMMFPPRAPHAPIAKGSRKVAVIGPEATPPESNAIAVKIFGTEKVSKSAIAYPGIINQKIEMPVPKARFSMGKIKTTLQMISIAAFLSIFAIGTLITPASDSRTLMYLIYILPQVGIWGLWLSLVASVWSATQYTITFLGHLKKMK
jgi:hypothetical protein